MDLDVADVQEIDALHLAEFADDMGNIILTIRAERTGANSEPVARAVNHGCDFIEIIFVLDDARQAKDGNRRVIGVNSHLDADFFIDRNDGFQEIFQVLAQAVFIHAFILFKQV